MIAGTSTNLWDGALSNAIGGAGVNVWTGTNIDGSSIVGGTCTGWTDPSAIAAYGNDAYKDVLNPFAYQ